MLSQHILQKYLLKDCNIPGDTAYYLSFSAYIFIRDQ